MIRTSARVAIGVFTSSLVTLGTVPLASAQSAVVKLVQWNAYHSGRGTDNVTDRQRQVNWLAGQVPDVVTMNEVSASNVADYKLKMQQATGQAWQAYPVKMQTDGRGNLILSRWSSRQRWLPRSTRSCATPQRMRRLSSAAGRW